ncbi:DUF2520 domain-containing protein [Oceanirhabdus sp. W0125-5]|nr:Rossmann-like and DUF2520 domain-containing protein [Oceanirhabdus sp. W0125-5]WBW98711.1 DUF2520 domain-containing protein [Oceanirhabdus sp. W0125-5]
MKISFVGAGKVGFTLGKYFKLNGLNIEGFFSNNPDSAIAASDFIGCSYFSSLDDLVKNSEIIFITTNDDSIIEVWKKLKDLNIEGKIICHCSGSLSSEIFYDINNSGAYQYSIHPMYPFKDKYNSYKNFKTAYFSMEGHPKYFDYLKGLLESLGNSVLSIPKERKGEYHLANVMVSNLVLSLINIGVETLSNCGVDSETALKAMAPLINSNIENILSQSFENAITGPVVRGDVNTLNKHIESMNGDYKELYKKLSLNLLKISKNKNPEKDYSLAQRFLETI